MRRWVLAAVVAGLGWAPGARAQVGPQPVLRVETATGQSSFHAGERIGLRLQFSAAAEKTFEINMAGYDRSGRMNYEQFAVEPAGGWTDPLRDYFGSLMGFLGGGISSSTALSTVPTVIGLDLNEWVRFDRPGEYTVRVTSGRVSRQVAGGSWTTVPVVSDALRVRVVAATPAWQAAALTKAEGVLAAVPEGNGQVPEARVAAVADVRYLGTDAAIAVMAAGLRDERRQEMYAYAFGLIGLPEAKRDVARKAVREEMEAPEFPVSGWCLTVAGFLEAGSLRGTPESVRAARVRGDAAAWREALAGLPRKLGQARAVTAATLLGQVPRDASAAEKQRLGSVLAASFGELKPDDQIAQLQVNWEILRGSDMLPLLRRLAAGPADAPRGAGGTTSYRRQLGAVALKRWHELDPAGAEREALLRVGSDSPSLGADDVSWLGTRTLPEFEGLWGQALLRETDYEREVLLTGLLARFGTGAAVAQVRATLEERVGRWACAPQAAALAYMVKFDPEGAKVYLERVEAARGKAFSGCRHGVLQEVGRFVSAPVLEKVALVGLNDADTDVTLDALIYLHDYGSADAQGPVWERYVRWTDGWAGKADGLERREAGDMAGNWQEVGLGESLGQTLLAGQGWVADAGLRARVLERCVGEQMCRQLKQVAAQTVAPYTVRVSPGKWSDEVSLGGYEARSAELLKAKVGQFARGTVFVFQPASDEEKERVAAVRAVLEDAGMVVMEQK